MLAKLADQLPPGGGYLYEPKWDGFRAIVSTEDKNLGEFGGIISSKKNLHCLRKRETKSLPTRSSRLCRFRRPGTRR